MAFLYIGTFGSFIGFSFAFPTLIKANFPELNHVGIMVALGNLAFLGALVGSVTRPLGGWLADRTGGAKITLVVFVSMAGGIALIMAALKIHNFPMYLAAFLGVFVLTGIGNGSTYRMIPTIFSAVARKAAAESGQQPADAMASAKRQAGAALGVVGAVGAFGGFVLQQALRLSNINFGSMAPAFWGYAALFLTMGTVTWWYYLRSAFVAHRMPSLAYANP
jgi:NNP family nitrate/nitrite transporter-like MFS transporter